MKNFARISISLVTLAGLAGLAAAGDGTTAAKVKPPTPAPDVKKAPTPAPPTDAKPAPAMEMPKVPADVAAAFKAMSGNWKCSGTAMDLTMKEIPTKGAFKAKMDLDGWWIVTSFTESKKNGFKMTQYSTFDAKAAKWTATSFDNMGSHETTESAGMKDNKMVWEGSAMSPMGTMKSRHTEELKGPKETHMMGEYSMDGKSWMKAYDMSCKK